MSESSPYALDGRATPEPKPRVSILPARLEFYLKMVIAHLDGQYPAVQPTSSNHYTVQLSPSSNRQTMSNPPPGFPRKPAVGQTYYTSLLPEPIQ